MLISIAESKQIASRKRFRGEPNLQAHQKSIRKVRLAKVRGILFLDVEHVYGAESTLGIFMEYQADSAGLTWA